MKCSLKEKLLIRVAGNNLFFRLVRAHLKQISSKWNLNKLQFNQSLNFVLSRPPPSRKNSQHFKSKLFFRCHGSTARVLKGKSWRVDCWRISWNIFYFRKPICLFVYDFFSYFEVGLLATFSSKWNFLRVSAFKYLMKNVSSDPVALYLMKFNPSCILWGGSKRNFW